jgi:transcriptional regulator with XRE-family HTH domain
MHESESIGAQIAAERKLRGMTQQQLATRAHVSLSLLRKVEQGSRQVTQSLISSVAVALGVQRTRLTGQPYRSGDRALDSVYDLAPDIRRELVAHVFRPKRTARCRP